MHVELKIITAQSAISDYRLTEWLTDRQHIIFLRSGGKSHRIQLIFHSICIARDCITSIRSVRLVKWQCIYIHMRRLINSVQMLPVVQSIFDDVHDVCCRLCFRSLQTIVLLLPHKTITLQNETDRMHLNMIRMLFTSSRCRRHRRRMWVCDNEQRTNDYGRCSVCIDSL